MQLFLLEVSFLKTGLLLNLSVCVFCSRILIDIFVIFHVINTGSTTGISAERPVSFQILILREWTRTQTSPRITIFSSLSNNLLVIKLVLQFT